MEKGKTMREKLIELLMQAKIGWTKAELTDYLIANGVTIQKWIPVTERLPEADIRVLVWIGENDHGFPPIDTDRVHDYSYLEERLRGKRWVRWDGNITHWMPLPEAPKEE